jgi:glutamyl-tRNA synthetase
MEITHIMRADEWISTAPLHINMYQAFGWDAPVYGHLSLVLNPSGKGKLSKRTQAFRDGDQQVLVQVEEFREAGYLPEALLNFLANVGWAFGDDREIFTMEEAIPRFELSNVNPAPAQLPYSKLEWLNGQYIQQMEPMELAKFVKPFLDAAGLEVNPEALLVIMPAMSKRMRLPTDAIEFLRFLFDDEPMSLTADQLTHKYLPRDAARTGFQQARDLVQTADPFDLNTLSEGLMKIGENVSANGKAGPFLGTLRLAVTGQQVSPPLFESILALGRARTLARLDDILALYN